MEKETPIPDQESQPALDFGEGEKQIEKRDGELTEEEWQKLNEEVSERRDRRSDPSGVW